MALSNDILILTLLLAQKFVKNYVDDHGSTAASGTAGTVTVGTNWSGGNPYTQNATTTYTVTSKTVVFLQDDPDIVAALRDIGVSQIAVKNNSGALTAYAMGVAPTASLTLPVVFFEVT